MTAAAALAGLAVGAGLLALTSGAGARSRLRGICPGTRGGLATAASRAAAPRSVAPDRAAGPAPVADRARPAGRLAVVLAACTVLFTAASPWGWLAAGVLAAVTAQWVGDRRRAARESDRRRVETRGVPQALDLLAACLDAGIWPVEALETVAGVVGGPLGHRLGQAAAAQRLGAEPAEAWGPLARDDPLGPVARAFRRVSVTGAPLSVTLGLVAEEARRRRHWAAQAAARRAGVLAVGPLVACFLPAFVLLGVVPVVVGVAGAVLGDLR